MPSVLAVAILWMWRLAVAMAVVTAVSRVVVLMVVAVSRVVVLMVVGLDVGGASVWRR